MGCVKISLIVLAILVGITSVLLLVILLPVSFKQVETNQYAIRWDPVYKTLSTDKVYEEGNYLLTPESTFFVFNRTIQNLDFTGSPVYCLSKDGLQMTLSITTQYQINKEKVINILLEHGGNDNWKDYLQVLTYGILSSTCGNYTADDYFNRRAEIERDMSSQLKTIYEKSNTYCTSLLVQLRNVAHPGAFVQANVDKQTKKQEKDRVTAGRQQEVAQATTLLLKAKEDAKIMLIKAQAKAQSLIDQANTLAPAENKKWEERGDALLNIWSQMENVTIDEFIDGYLRYSILQGKGKIISISNQENDVNTHQINLLDLAKLK